MPVEYTSEDSATLPSDDTDLSHVLDAGELTAISTDDDTTYAVVTNTAGYAIFQFENDTTGKTAVTVTWDGKSDIAPSSSEVFLQVYNRSGTPAWVTIDSENGVGAGTDFTLTATLNAGSTPTLANCQDGSGIIACRVYQATSTTPTVMDSNTSTADWNSYNETTSDHTYYQSFTGNGDKITKASLRLVKDSGLTGSAVIKIYAESHATAYGTDSICTGSVLATSDAVDISTLPTGWSTATDFTFTGAEQYATTNGNKYCLVIVPTITSGGFNIYIGRNDSSQAAGNAGYDLTNPEAAKDLYFVVEGV